MPLPDTPSGVTRRVSALEDLRNIAGRQARAGRRMAETYGRRIQALLTGRPGPQFVTLPETPLGSDLDMRHLAERMRGAELRLLALEHAHDPRVTK